MWGKRESLNANDNDLISVSLKIILAPSSGRGRRAKRGGVGIPACENIASRGQPPPLRGTSFQRKEGEKRGCVYRHRSICGEVGAFSAISATPEPAPTISFPITMFITMFVMNFFHKKKFITKSTFHGIIRLLLFYHQPCWQNSFLHHPHSELQSCRL